MWKGRDNLAEWGRRQSYNMCDLKPCKSRPSDAISPKRELQSLVFGPGSRYLPKRPWMGLSDLVSRSSERHSPKRGREETWIVLSAKPRPSEEFAQARLNWVFGREMISPKRDNVMRPLF
ncbi:hypothetical protein DEO72_LG6g802 [Vigna unguiculata]|uniref:Uncharacterized protein n=1 Tax=Vigna unguiculata TaxID=3917 RepID=A0A4D6M5Z5_VIGUN|nr:hypothetical protein DEO72_LG6g802 [Vigna unguiculata]